VVVRIDAEEARRFEAELLSVQSQLDEAGVEHEVRQLVRGNEPSQDLIEVANEVNADFIVIGLRRRTPVGKLILGSNAQRILLDASCPVLCRQSRCQPTEMNLFPVRRAGGCRAVPAVPAVQEGALLRRFLGRCKVTRPRV